MIKNLSLEELENLKLIKFGRGKIISKKDIKKFPGSYPVYSSSKIGGGKFGEYSKFIFDEELITWSIDGGGKFFYRNKHKFSITNVAGFIKILNKSFINYQYLYLVLTSLHAEIKFDWVKKAHPSVIKKLYKNIPIPNIEKQKIISNKLIDILSKFNEMILNIEENINNLQILFEKNLDKILNDNNQVSKMKIGDIIKIKHGFAFKSRWFSKNGTYVLLSPGNFFEKGGYKDRGVKQKYYTGSIKDEYILNKNDLLIVMTEQAPGLLGSPMLVPKAQKFLHNQRLGLVQPKVGFEYLQEYMFYICNTSNFRNTLYKTGTGIKVRHTSPEKIENVIINYCKDKKKQKIIVNKISELDNHAQTILDGYKIKIKLLNELKESLVKSIIFNY